MNANKQHTEKAMTQERIEKLLKAYLNGFISAEEYEAATGLKLEEAAQSEE